MDVKIRRGKQSTEYNGVSLWNFWKKPRVREIGYVLILVRDWSDWRYVSWMLKLEEGSNNLPVLNILVYRLGIFGRSHECEK